jgi:hypothetical protein
MGNDRYVQPGWFTRNIFNRLVSIATNAGLSIWGSRVLQVRGRKSGQIREVPVNLLSFDGGRYLVAPRGVTQRIEVVRGDITTVNAEVLVTAANSALAGGGGADGAIHRAAGPELLLALRPLAPCPPGSAVITPAFGLPAPVRHVVHAVGPRSGVDEPAADLLASAYLTSLRLRDDAAGGTRCPGTPAAHGRPGTLR